MRSLAGYGKLATMDSSPTPVTNPAPAKGWRIYKEQGADMVGEVIAGRYQILRRIATGGMADVFLARRTSPKSYVAIKILRSRSPESRRRFKVEADVLGNLQHPGIVRASDFGETADGQSFMALEYLEGEPLSARLANGPLPWREAVEYGIQVAAAVHALHVAGIVHRDLTPDNIMVTMGADRVTAKVIDLGLASVGAPYQDVQDARFPSDPPERHPTQLGHPIGTPPYLPPEAGQCPAEPRLDVYSLAATLYQLCTRRLPREAGGLAIAEMCPGSDAPGDLSRLLQAALAADPNERLPSADHLRRGLEAVLAAHPRDKRPLLGGSYDRIEVLGVGASAIVYRASDRWLSREVAVKVLRDEATADDVIRFRRAAKVLSALHHPNIPRILHFGIHDEQFFAVTELCTGSPATVYARPNNHLRPDEVLAVGLQLAGALAAVHAAGVVYRDLHPGNVLIARGETPRAWIFDFDQAQVSPEFYAALTERYATPPEERQEPKHEKPLQAMDYAAPEVRAGAAFSVASDVYALGLLLYRLLTGLRPFPVTGGEPVPPRKACPACPRGLERLLLAMLHPSSDKRPALAMILATLEDEQAELAADLTERENSDPKDVDPEPPATRGEQAADLVPVATDDTVTAEPATVFVSTTAGAVAATTADEGPPPGVRGVIVDPTPGRRLRRSSGLWALGLTAAVSLAIGRMTASGDRAERDASALASEASRADDDRAAGSPGTTTAPSRDAPPAAPDALARPLAAPDASPAAGPDTATAPSLTMPDAPRNDAHPAAESKREGTQRARREPVAPDEATTAAERAVPSLRTCKDVPRRVTADLDIVRGRGVVTALNLHAPAPDDPAYPWHACTQRHLEGVRFPVSETAGHVRIRLSLR